MSVSKEKLFGLLTICRKAGRMTMGFDSVKESILTDKAKAVFLASDISAKTEKESMPIFTTTRKQYNKDLNFLL